VLVVAAQATTAFMMPQATLGMRVRAVARSPASVNRHLALTLRHPALGMQVSHPVSHYCLYCQLFFIGRLANPDVSVRALQRVVYTCIYMHTDS
jgi:hypothetical protein